MKAQVFGDLVLVLHAAWIAIVVLAPLWAWRRPRWRWVHLGMMALTLGFAATTGVCPLTDIENLLWSASRGTPAYAGGFLRHYLWEFVYWDVSPLRLNLAAGLWFVLWAAVYGALWQRERALMQGNGLRRK